MYIGTKQTSEMKNWSAPILVILFLVPVLAEAQSFYNFTKDRSLLLTGGIGTTSYFGDLKDPGDLLDARFNLSAGLQHYFYPRLSVRSELSMFMLRGDDESSEDAARRRRNLSFKSTNFELNAVGIIDLVPRPRRFHQRSKYNAYGFLGIGVMYMNPKAELDGETYALQPLRTEDKSYSRFQFVVPYGIGGRMKVSPFLDLGVEASWRITFTDYMDDVSTEHPDKSGWTDPIRIELSDRSEDPKYYPGAVRGDPRDNDQYFFLQVKASYYLPRNFLFGDTQRKLNTVKRKAYRR